MIDPGFLDELDRFQTGKKRHVEDRFPGEEESPEVGEGLTFSDYRRYSPGDDTRLIDWKLYARTRELYVKVFEEERNFTVHVLVDASESMAFGDQGETKFDRAAKLGLGFCYLTADEGNDFRFSTFTGSYDRLDGGSSSAGEVLALVDRCNAVEPAGEADFEEVLQAYAETIRSRALVLIASDFLEDIDAIETGLSALSRNRLVLGHVIAPDEWELPVRGDTVFEALERDVSRRAYVSGRLAQEYHTRLEEHVTEIADRSDDLRARHELVRTDDAFFDAFSRIWVD